MKLTEIFIVLWKKLHVKNVNAWNTFQRTIFKQKYITSLPPKQ